MAEGILTHLLETKFKHSASATVAGAKLSRTVVHELLCNVVQRKFELRAASGDVHDELVRYLSGEDAEGSMEISYTKQQQKQKQKQTSKSHDSDTMQSFDQRHQLSLSAETANYFADTLTQQSDKPKTWLNLPVAAPIYKVSYTIGGRRRYVSLYPTLQFLYSHHIMPEYISMEVKNQVATFNGITPERLCERFFKAVEEERAADEEESAGSSPMSDSCEAEVLINHVRQNPQYTVAGIREGVFLIGMKDQFNKHDLPNHPLQSHIQFVADEMGFILVDKTGTAGKNVNSFGPYCIDLYMIMELLSKQEIAQTVIDYYEKQREKLQRGVERYSEAQGKGFICWRFFDEYRQK
jgi:hypothetical protein